MRQAELARYRHRLEEQLQALAQHGAETVRDLVAEKEGLPDPSDRATREEDLREELRLRDRDRKLAAKIEQALSRIQDGTFGRCQACGGHIAPARLRARPVTELCIDCKRDAEGGERRV